MTVQIRRIALPAAWDEASDVGGAFRERTALLAAAADAHHGPGVTSITGGEALVVAQPSPQLDRHEVGAYAADADGRSRLVGVRSSWMTTTESTDVYDFGTAADPALPADERARIHEALVGEAVAHAAAVGRTTVMGGSPGVPRGEVMAATGFGGVDPTEPAAAPLVARGFSLEQVYRVSVASLATLADPAGDLDARIAAAEARAGDYRLVAWTGDVPAEHREGMWTLHARMSTDAPIGDLALEPELWDEGRLAAFERRQHEGGRTILTVAAQARVTGGLVGFSTLFVPAEGDVARQHDTLVAQGHRGHGLGMLLKLANLRALAAHPRIARVTTWNAEENRPMLDVNEAVGFAPAGYEAVWQLAPRAAGAAAASVASVASDDADTSGEAGDRVEEGAR